jgi:hypothetical protein
MRLPYGQVHCLDCGDMSELHCAVSAPLAMFLACYTAAFDSPQRCLADELLRAPGGPVAVIGGSRTTMPYAMTVFGSEMIDQCFRDRASTIGEAMLGAKCRMIRAGQAGWDSRRLLMDALAKAASPPGSDLAAERFEHLQLFNLIGDPLLTLRFPKEMEVTAERSALAGDRIPISGHAPCDGRCTIELVSEHDAGEGTALRQKFDDSDDALAAYQWRYRAMNHPPQAAVETAVERGKFAATLPIPENSAGRFKIRAFVAGKCDCAAGAVTLQVNKTAARGRTE